MLCALCDPFPHENPEDIGMKALDQPHSQVKWHILSSDTQRVRLDTNKEGSDCILPAESAVHNQNDKMLRLICNYGGQLAGCTNAIAAGAAMAGASREAEDDDECPICTQKASDPTGLLCGHKYCLVCYTQTSVQQISRQTQQTAAVVFTKYDRIFSCLDHKQTSSAELEKSFQKLSEEQRKSFSEIQWSCPFRCKDVPLSWPL